MGNKIMTKQLWEYTEEKPRYGFMCMVDYEHELGAAAGGNVIFPSIAETKEHRKCTDECGIVKVMVLRVATVQEENYPKPTFHYKDGASEEGDHR